MLGGSKQAEAVDRVRSVKLALAQEQTAVLITSVLVSRCTA